MLRLGMLKNSQSGAGILVGKNYRITIHDTTVSTLYTRIGMFVIISELTLTHSCHLFRLGFTVYVLEAQWYMTNAKCNPSV